MERNRELTMRVLLAARWNRNRHNVDPGAGS
jgi:hypothetical protein